MAKLSDLRALLDGARARNRAATSAPQSLPHAKFSRRSIGATAQLGVFVATGHFRDGVLVNARSGQFIFDPNLNLMRAGPGLGSFEGDSDYFGDGTPLSPQLDLARIDAGQFGQTFDKAIESVGFLVDYLQHFFATFVAERSHELARALRPPAAAQRIFHRRRHGSCRRGGGRSGCGPDAGARAYRSCERLRRL